MTQATVIEGTTEPVRQWSANAATPDLMTALKAATDAISQRPPLGHDTDAAIEDLIEWSLARPADVGAERLRSEAW